MDFTTRRARYRGILEGDVCVHPGSVFDPISARIAEDLGFEVGMFAGSIASFTVLGAPDLVVLTLTEFAQQIHRICRAGDLSLMVDADHGYGNALSVMRTVEELETAGVSALTIEDTVLPVSFGANGAQLLSVDEGIGKMKAALAARTDPALCIAGRTSALRVSDVGDTIARVKAYEAAGVDAIFLAGANTRDEVAAVASELSVPLLLGGTTGELQDKEWLGGQRRPRGVAGASALLGGGEGGVRHPQGPARRCVARRPARQHRRRRYDGPVHPPRQLQPVDSRFPELTGDFNHREHRVHRDFQGFLKFLCGLCVLCD